MGVVCIYRYVYGQFAHKYCLYVKKLRIYGLPTKQCYALCTDNFNYENSLCLVWLDGVALQSLFHSQIR